MRLRPVGFPENVRLMVSPLISLMKDQVDGLRQQGVAAAYLNSSQTRDERASVHREIAVGRFSVERVVPVYETMEGWAETTEPAARFSWRQR